MTRDVFILIINETHHQPTLQVLKSVAEEDDPMINLRK